jgi:hypothetical protein
MTTLPAGLFAHLSWVEDGTCAEQRRETARNLEKDSIEYVLRVFRRAPSTFRMSSAVFS